MRRILLFVLLAAVAAVFLGFAGWIAYKVGEIHAENAFHDGRRFAVVSEGVSK